MWNVSDKSFRENKNTNFTFNNIFVEYRAIHEIMWKNTVEPERPQITIWRMRIAYCVPKATNTHSEYIILFAFHYNICRTNVSQCYVICTLPALLRIPFNVISSFSIVRSFIHARHTNITVTRNSHFMSLRFVAIRSWIYASCPGSLFSRNTSYFKFKLLVH